MDPVAPCIAERLDLLRLAADMLAVAVLHIAARGGPLEIRVELDAVRRVDVDALHLAAQPFALGETRHHLQRVTQNQAVGPVRLMLIKLGGRSVVW